MSGLARRLARQQHKLSETRAEDPPRIQSDELHVMISSPMMDMCHSAFAVALVNMYAYTAINSPPGLSIGFNTFSTSILQYSREALGKKAIELGATHMLWVDSDMDFPPDTLMRLLRHGKDFVAANCMARREPYAITARDESNKEIMTNVESTGLEKCNRVGLAVALVSMEIFKTIPEPWFNHEWLPESNYNLITGEDVAFCRKARGAGFEIYIDHDLSKQVLHLGTFGYNPIYKSTFAQQETNK